MTVRLARRKTKRRWLQPFTGRFHLLFQRFFHMLCFLPVVLVLGVVLIVFTLILVVLLVIIIVLVVLLVVVFLVVVLAVLSVVIHKRSLLSGFMCIARV